MIKAVIFDVDGTLVDSVNLHAKAWQVAFEKFDKEVSFEAIRRQIGKGADQLLPVFFLDDELRRFGRELDEYRGELFRAEYLPQVKPFAKVRELFERLRRDGRKIALASSAKEDELDEYKKNRSDRRSNRGRHFVRGCRTIQAASRCFRSGARKARRFRS